MWFRSAVLNKSRRVGLGRTESGGRGTYTIAEDCILSVNEVIVCTISINFRRGIDGLKTQAKTLLLTLDS